VAHQSSQTIEYNPNHFDDMRLELAMQQVQSLEADVNDHVARLRDCEEERDEFENQVRLLESNSKSMQKNSMEYLLNQRDREIARLRGELEDSKSLSRFTRLDAASHEVFEPNIIQGFVELFSMSEQILCERSRCNVTTMQHHGQHKELHDITSHIFTQSDASEEVTQSLLRKLSELDPGVVLRALTSSLLIKWVFETNYPCIEESSAEYRDIAKLRNILLMKGKLTCSIDVAF
jgi:chromosome segregation ATPase